MARSDYRSAHRELFSAHRERLESSVTDAVNAAVRAQPADPVGYIGHRLIAMSEAVAATVAADEESTAEAEAVASEWTATGWLASAGIEKVVARALLGASQASDELSTMRTLGRSDRLEEVLRERLVAAAGAIAARLTPRLRELALDEAATGAELQEKFSQDTRGLLEYGSLSTFFGGLEALVGTPNHSVKQTMEDEHTRRDDSEREFVTQNYDVRTSSAVEWAFVATPDKPPAGGFPKEEKILRALAPEGARRKSKSLIAIQASGAQPRKPKPVAELEAVVEEKWNAQLRTMSEPEMSTEEALGLRLYTGPLFVKYNAVLRGLNSLVPFLQAQVVKLCCSAEASERFAAGEATYEEVKPRANIYTTTLHVINSGIVKTSKLTYAGKVYRGVSGMALPDQFWKANKHGVRGGIESAFMSTTSDRKVAMQYAASGGRGVVFEIQQGMIDLGYT